MKDDLHLLTRSRISSCWEIFHSTLPPKDSLRYTTSDMPFIEKKATTLYDKVFNDHIVDEREDGTILLYIGTALRSLSVIQGLSEGLMFAKIDTLSMK